jgi:diguanylate cyclase
MSRRGRAALGCGLLIAMFILELAVEPGGDELARKVDDAFQLLAAASAAAAAAWRAGQETARLRLSWLLIAGGAASWAGGQTIWTYYELVLERPVPFPSAADFGFLLLPVLAIAGVLVRPSRAFLGRGRWRICLDATLVVTSLFTVSWGTALGQVYRGGAGSLVARTVALAYPAGDLALLAIVVTVLSYAHAGRRLGVICIGSGLAALAIADSGFAYLTAVGRYETGDLVDAAWVTGFVILGFAAYVDRADEWDTTQRHTPYTTTLMPYAPAIVGIGFAMWELAGGGPDRPLGVSTALLVVVLLVRQIVVVLDNGELAGRMEHQAFHDVLTGVANRALFNDRLRHALELRRRDGRQVAVLLIDLDDFKVVNDTLGHTAGDELLTKVAARLQAAARAGDTVARLGGDEFAILMEDRGSARDLARRVLEELRRPIRLAGRVTPLSGSIGIAAIDEAAGDVSATDVLHQADLALYAAKRTGKGTAQMYSAEMVTLNPRQIDLREALLADITRQALDVAVQPIYRSTGELYAVEALARWSHAGAAIPPATFLPMARELDCVPAIDELVLRKAVAAVAAFDGVTVTVNVDGRTLGSSGYAQQITETLGEHNFSPSRLVIEVLELGQIERDEIALKTLHQLRQLGVRVAVDDFGVGYATLARLRALRPDILKIDRSLVVGSDTDEVAALLLGSAVRLGQLIGAQVVAEGIETESELNAALGAGCDAVQGMLLGPPAPPDTLADLFGRPEHASTRPVPHVVPWRRYGRIAR